MKISVGVQRGQNKLYCDDTVLVGKTIINDREVLIDDTVPFAICVADGVGGNAGGKDASIFVMQEILSLLPEYVEKNGLYKYFQDMNQALLKYGDQTSDKKTMATTFTGLFFVGDKIYLVHIGNTRLYSMQGAYLKQLTEDHTTYQWLINAGQYEVAEQCNKNEITACFGGGNTNLANSLELRPSFH